MFGALLAARVLLSERGVGSNWGPISFPDGRISCLEGVVPVGVTVLFTQLGTLASMPIGAALLRQASQGRLLLAVAERRYR